jgi:hypothetical protein
MDSTLTNVWFWLFAIVVISRNVVAALPKPGDSTAPTGFGSNSVGYQFCYRLMQGLSADLASVSSQTDMRNIRKSLIKSDSTPRVNGEDTVIIPPTKKE